MNSRALMWPGSGYWPYSCYGFRGYVNSDVQEQPLDLSATSRYRNSSSSSSSSVSSPRSSPELFRLSPSPDTDNYVDKESFSLENFYRIYSLISLRNSSPDVLLPQPKETKEMSSLSRKRKASCINLNK